MKILHLGKYFAPFSGGIENYMRDAMVALARRGIDTLALVHQHRLSLRTEDELVALGGFELPVTRTGLWARFLYTPISPTFAWHLHRIIRSSNPDILHLHMPNPSIFWALFLPSARGIPWVVHWHADVITAQQGRAMQFFYRLYRPFERAVLRRAKTIIATSPPYRDSSLPLKNCLDKCRVVPLGMDTEKYAALSLAEDFNEGDTPQRPSADIATARQAGNEPRPLRVLAIGRLTYYKGFKYLLEAIARTPGACLNLIGRGEEAERLHALANDLDISNRVRFLGHLSDTELAREMLACDCLCLPSIERTEAFGMVLLEAMYHGKATVIGDVEGSGMGWVVDDGLTGIKVRPADSNALAHALLRLSENREELIRMGQAGRQKFDEQFDINRSVEGLLDVYRQIKPESTAN